MPAESYGVLRQTEVMTAEDRAVEDLRRDGFTILSGLLPTETVEEWSRLFDQARARYISHVGGSDVLVDIDEQHGVRAPFVFERRLLEVARQGAVMSICRRLLGEYVVLNQQNGVINPERGASYNQGKWHRDLPYQHIVFSRPVLVNALYCVDDFTRENGATLVLPGSHLIEEFPSDSYVQRRAVEAVAPAGSFIILDGMTYHSGGVNRTDSPRRAINHVYSIPQIAQQIDFSRAVSDWDLEPELRQFLGTSIPQSVEEFIGRRPSTRRRDQP